MHRTVALDIALPPGAHVEAVAPSIVEDGPRRVTITDSVKDGVLHLTRTIDIPAGRTQASEYPTFARFAQQADDTLSRAVRVQLP
jgi:hypothetical protein